MAQCCTPIPVLPLILGRSVCVGHMAMVHGCTINDGSLIGIKAVVMNGAVIGKHCLIGSNALVPEGKTIPDGSLVLGSPGRVVRQLTTRGNRSHSAHRRLLRPELQALPRGIEGRTIKVLRGVNLSFLATDRLLNT